jgi:hypothetical protein
MDPLLWLFQQKPKADWAWQLDAQGRSWHRDQALSLANVSLLMYSDAPDIQAGLLARGFTQATVCESPHALLPSTAVLAVRPDAIVVAFRGTRPANPLDLMVDLNLRQVPLHSVLGGPDDGQVHEGFARGMAAVLPGLQAALAQADAAGGAPRPIWITGHSLGGAMAMLCALQWARTGLGQRVAGVITFGQPRTGDDTLGNRYEALLGDRTWRCVNDTDLITHLPPRQVNRLEQVLAQPGLGTLIDLANAVVDGQVMRIEHYAHTRQLRLLLPAGGLSDQAADEQAREPAFLQAGDVLSRGVLALPGLPLALLQLKDHAPINPTTHDGYTERLARLP